MCCYDKILVNVAAYVIPSCVCVGACVCVCVCAHALAGARVRCACSLARARVLCGLCVCVCVWCEVNRNHTTHAHLTRNYVCSCMTTHYYEGRLISNAHSEIYRKSDHVFKQTKVGSKVQYFSLMRIGPCIILIFE